MSTLQTPGFFCTSSSSCSNRISTRTYLHAPKLNSVEVSYPKLQTRNLVKELDMRSNTCPTTITNPQELATSTSGRDHEGTSKSLIIAELYAILDSISDRIEMHANVGEQRNNWNALLLTSINAITITAATMAGLTSIAGTGKSVLALELSSTLLYSAATGLLLVMNKIQPSQLAEEQRNAVRLFKQLQRDIQMVLALGIPPTSKDVRNAMKKVLALDRAFPLPLLGGVMLEKFPETVEPAVWWSRRDTLECHFTGKAEKNGWSRELEIEMKNISELLDRKDEKEYVKLSKLILYVNKVLAVSGPLLTGLAAAGSTLVGSPSHGSWPAVFAIVGGVLASVVNTIEHGGQVGMIFEMYRVCAGSFQQLRESIELTLEEREVDRRENGEVFEMKVALQLGRSLSELRNLADNAPDEFGSKLL